MGLTKHKVGGKKRLSGPRIKRIAYSSLHQSMNKVQHKLSCFCPNERQDNPTSILTGNILEIMRKWHRPTTCTIKQREVEKCYPNWSW